MKLERVKNSKRNIFHGLSFRLLGTLLPFINRTVLLRVLGIEYLGLNSLFASIIGVLSLAELGFGTAIIFCMYKPIAEDDIETVCGLLEIYKIIYRRIGLIIIVIGLCISPFLEYFISGEVPSGVNIHLVFFIQLSNTVIDYCFFAYRSSILSAYQREDIVSKVASWTLVLQYILQFAILFSTKDYYTYLMVMPFITLIRNIIKYRIASRLFPFCKIKSNKKIDDHIKKDIITKANAFFLHRVGGVVINSLDSVVISAFLGLSATAMFNNYWNISYSVVNTVTIFYSSILAGIGNSVASESKEKNYEKFKQLTVLNNWIVGWCAICLLCLYQPFMKLWVGEDLLFPFHTAVLFVVSFYVSMIRKINHTFKDANGLWFEDRLKPLVSGLVNAILNIIMIQIIGIDGVILSTIISISLIEFPWEVFVLFKTYFKTETFHYYVKLFMSTVIIAFVAFLTYFVSVCVTSHFVNNNISVIIITGMICLVLPNILFFLVWRNQIGFIKTYLRK